MTAAYLVADLGATNARFALLNELSRWPSDAASVRQVTLPTGAYGSAADLLNAARAELGFAELAAACLAMAGPVIAGSGASAQGRMTNSQLLLDTGALQSQLACPVTLVNDFAALARGVPQARDRLQIGGDPGAQGVIAVLGPGSGLGVSALIPGEPWPQVLPSEGGHADLAPGTPLEQEILQLLSREHGTVSWETVLSGPGLVNLYRAMAALWGVEPQEASPEWVAEQGRLAGEPICHQTLETFFGFLGAAAGNLALTFAASGGVFVAGGIVPALAEFALTSPLRRRFEERGELAEYVASVPIWIILDAQPGLVGALECLRQARAAER